MNNGKLVQAGIGMAINRGPFDTVAVFPSRLVKVDIRAQQVTIEMQGLEVSAMIEWTVDKEGEGPMKAYKNLGTDLASSTPYTANSMLSDMASSILRNKIANSTINEVIKGRQELRDAVIKDMSEVTKGWGVHLETVEVTDVRILSGTLFSNMQTKFREQNRKTATLQKNLVDN
jgi:regulator of protease activity HflC (stomatin/prohibitin superfamily)